VAEADNEISENQGALCKAIEETASWLGKENRGRIRDFEEEIGERLACLNLTSESARASQHERIDCDDGGNETSVPRSS
jgi:hypothetical protein